MQQNYESKLEPFNVNWSAAKKKWWGGKRLKEAGICLRQRPDPRCPMTHGAPRAFWDSVENETDEGIPSEAIVAMTALHVKPPNWQWDARDLQKFTKMPVRATKRGIKVLKERGWVSHVNLYIEGSIVTTFIVVNREPLEEEERHGRFSMSLRGGRWKLKAPSGRTALLDEFQWGENVGEGLKVLAEETYSDKGSDTQEEETDTQEEDPEETDTQEEGSDTQEDDPEGSDTQEDAQEEGSDTQEDDPEGSDTQEDAQEEETDTQEEETGTQEGTPEGGSDEDDSPGEEEDRSGEDLYIHRERRHSTSGRYSSQTLLRRASENSSAPSAKDEESDELSDSIEDSSRGDSEPPVKNERSDELSDSTKDREPSEQSDDETTLRPSRSFREIAADLEKLGRRAFDDTADDTVPRVAYEEFINEEVIPRLEKPRPTSRRRKIWCLQWAESSMWGALFLQMSRDDENWNNNQARRLAKRVEEGYIKPEDMRAVLYFFDWRRHKKSLELWTKRGWIKDDFGDKEWRDDWAKKVENSWRRFMQEGRMMATDARNELCPPGGSNIGEDKVHRILSEMEKMVGVPDDQIDLRRVFAVKGAKGDDAVGYLMSRAPGHWFSEDIIEKIEDARGWWLRFFSTTEYGATVFKQIGHMFPREFRFDPDEIRRRHREYVEMLRRRLRNYGLPAEGLEPLL